jgi:ribosome-associated heat shock protein Hsp15
MTQALTGTRIDKWLWAARFFKTRGLACQAVEGGRARVNDARVKPSKEIRVGDRLRLHIGDYEWELTVLALAERRGPAEVARTLYQESEASQRRRAEQAAQRRLAANPAADLRGRPSKKAGRLIRRFTESE